jgi:hypothetical protein
MNTEVQLLSEETIKVPHSLATYSTVGGNMANKVGQKTKEVVL